MARARLATDAVHAGNFKAKGCLWTEPGAARAVRAWMWTISRILPDAGCRVLMLKLQPCPGCV